MPEQKNNPLIAVLLALLVAAIGALGLMQKTSFDQIWSKIDRVTALMMQKEEGFRNDMRAVIGELTCQGKEIERLKVLNGKDKK
jgi:hypothetical protein